jgi:hypothetical protein
MLDFYMYQSGIVFKCPYSNHPLKPLTPLNRLSAIFVLAVDWIAKSPYLFNWSMSSAIDLYGISFSQVPALAAAHRTRRGRALQVGKN